MEKTFDHNRLLKQIAREKFQPYGIVQQGKSRTFLYDNGWWTVVVEFQASSFSRGTYLNIGVDLNFYPRDYFAFTYGSREKGFEQAKDEAHFVHIIGEYCDFAINKVAELKSKFKDVPTAINSFKTGVSGDSWDLFNLAILHGLAGNFGECKKHLTAIRNRKCEYDYELKRLDLVKEILTWLDDTQSFRGKIGGLINRARQLKKLPIVDLGNLG
jgi:hypothetical protein